MSRLIAAAQADGDMNPDVTADDFILLLATAPLDQPPAILHRWLTLVLRGFTTTTPTAAATTTTAASQPAAPQPAHPQP
jgi:hypothetical protein